MKVAIPTDDGLHISAKCEWAKGFVIAEVEGEKIISEVLRWNPEPDGNFSSVFSLIGDCNVVIAGDQSENCRRLHMESGKEIIVVTETIITNALVEYLETRFLRESNTCCCP